MKIIIKYSVLFLVFCIRSKDVFSQSVHFTCYMKTQCSINPIQIKKYTLSNADTTFYSNDSGVCYISKLGTYTIGSADYYIVGERKQVILNQFGTYIHTFQEEALYILSRIGGGIYKEEWQYCGIQCNGYYIDYYHNGNKRVEGTFRKGKAVGVLKSYDESGKLIIIDYYNKRGKHIRTEYVGNKKTTALRDVRLRHPEV